MYGAAQCARVSVITTALTLRAPARSGSSLTAKDRERVVDTIEMWREWGYSDSEHHRPAANE